MPVRAQCIYIAVQQRGSCPTQLEVGPRWYNVDFYHPSRPFVRQQSWSSHTRSRGLSKDFSGFVHISNVGFIYFECYDSTIVSLFEFMDQNYSYLCSPMFSFLLQVSKSSAKMWWVKNHFVVFKSTKCFCMFLEILIDFFLNWQFFIVYRTLVVQTIVRCNFCDNDKSIRNATSF